MARLLHHNGHLDKDQLADLLEQRATSAEEADNSPFEKGEFRLDTFLMKSLAKTLRDPEPQARWSPVVIEGGPQSPSEDQDSSD